MGDFPWEVTVSFSLRALASYYICFWVIHGTVSGLHRTSFVSAVSAPAHPAPITHSLWRGKRLAFMNTKKMQAFSICTFASICRETDNMYSLSHRQLGKYVENSGI